MRKFLISIFSALLLFANYAEAKIDKFSRVADGIYRGDQPDNKDDFQYLKSIGIRTIINLRDDPKLVDWEYAMTASAGIDLRSFPINSIKGPSKRTMNAILKALSNPNLQPVFIHCKQGKDRTGLAIGLYRYHFEGWTQAKAWNEMLSFGFRPILIGLSSFYFSHTD